MTLPIITKSTGIVLLSGFLLACSSNNESKERRSALQRDDFQAGIQINSESVADYSNNKPTYYAQANSVQQKKLVKTGNITLKSRRIEQSKAYLDQALQSVNGYYDKESFTKTDGELRYTLRLRVPEEKFNQLLLAVNRGSDEIISKNIRAEDVSEEYNDIETRLKSKRAYLKRYQEIMSKAKNVDELLQIEGQVRLLIEEIESQEGRMRFLDNRSEYGTINIRLFKTLPHKMVEQTDEEGFGTHAADSFSTGWHAVTGFVLWLLSIWPLLIILVPAGIFGSRKLRRFLNRKPQ